MHKGEVKFTNCWKTLLLSFVKCALMHIYYYNIYLRSYSVPTSLEWGCVYLLYTLLEIKVLTRTI